MKRDNAFTGLEAAIVLIAFVVVAAVFSYVMLGAGFFATQKAQEVTYAGIKQATSNVVFEGMVYGEVNEDDPTGSILTGFSFSVKVPGGGMPIDMSNTEFVYTSTKTIPPITMAGTYRELKEKEGLVFDNPLNSGYPEFIGYFRLDPLTGEVSTLLQPGESAIYTVVLDGPDPGDTYLSSGEWFSLEMVPQIGASTLMTKRLDAGLKNGKPLL